MNPKLATGALLALLAMSWIVRAARGIQRRRLTTETGVRVKFNLALPW